MPPLRLRTKLLVSHALVVALVLGGIFVGMRLLAPPAFDRLLVQRGRGPGRGAAVINATVREVAQQVFDETLFWTLGLTMLGAMLLTILISAYVARRITAPLSRLVDVSSRIARGEYAVRVPMEGSDEIGNLAACFNSMASALQEEETRRVHLIGDVAHEMRTPLTTLRGYLEGLRDGVVQPSEALWDQLEGETARLHRLIDDLQQLSRVESGSLPLEKQALSANDLIGYAERAWAARYAAKNVALRAIPHLSELRVLADRGRTLEIFDNLLSNALRYTPAGGEVTVRVAPELADARFEVSDTGLGIPPEHLSRVFDRFYRVDPARARALGGAGVGLTIARALVQAQGGRIWATSAGAGGGSTFSFTLPRAGDSALVSGHSRS